ncbi:hypothetical protein JW916_07505 [Candidatus Sumerlaeota bacterium]|nr:hypothetical protein [Candidatus Sumerlaeota bacterium]
MVRTVTILSIVLLVCLSTGVWAQATLKAHWKFDSFNPATPLTADGGSGVPASSYITADMVTTTAPPALPGYNFGSAIQFDGVDDTIIIPDAPALRFGTGDFSISMWVKARSSELEITGRNGALLVKGANPTDVDDEKKFYRLNFSDARFVVRLRDGSTADLTGITYPDGTNAGWQANAQKQWPIGTQISDATPANEGEFFDGSWKHVVITREAWVSDPFSTRTLSCYRNGELYGTLDTYYNPDQADPPDPTKDQTGNTDSVEPLRLGHWDWTIVTPTPDPASDFYDPNKDGTYLGPYFCMDDLRFYDGALTLTEIQNMYVEDVSGSAVSHWEIFD